MRASKMTIITGLKFTEVDTSERGFVRARSFNLGCSNRYPRIPLLEDAEPPEELAYTDYYIRGRRVRTPNGKEVFLGNAPEVEEFLGLQFDLFENMKGKMDVAFSECNILRQKVTELEFMHQQSEHVWQAREEEIKTMSFFKRLKFLFTGELI